MELFARGRSLNKTETSADPCGGFYFRKADHLDPHETDNRFKRRADKLIYGLDVHIMVAADASHPDRSYYPSIPFRMTADRPGFKPGAAARRMFATIDTSQHNLRYLAGDRLYTNLVAETFQIPARDMGFGLVLAYGKDESGDQHSHDSGMRLVDGTYYGPCMPDNLDTLTEDLRTKKIDLNTYTDSIKQRVQFRMRQKQKATATTQERLGCPASGANPIAICALKPTSQAPRPTKQDDGSIADTRPVIRHTKVLTNGKAPAVCTKDSVTVTATDGAKFRQPLAYGSVKHSRVYNALRQGQEGVHGSVKDKAQEAFDAPARRRVRGLAAQQLFASILLAAVATRRIKTFLSHAKRDEHGDLYVPKTLRTDDHATTNMPPGVGETKIELYEPDV